MRVYDLVMTHKLDADDFFIHRVQRHCAEAGLNFFLIEPLWVEEFLAKLTRGELSIRVLLNMHSEHHAPDDVFHRLVRLASAKGAKVIDPPDVALAAFNKALLHPRLAEAGFTVPPTLIVPREQAAAFQLTAQHKELLGAPFVIKPGLGYGRKGVLLDATGEADLARSAAAWPDAHYLLQRRIRPADVLGEPAYFRVYFVFGSVWMCWWNCFTDRYRKVEPAEVEQHNLKPLEDIVRRVAVLSGMNFFSSEIARTEAGENVLIDYVNDQCHLLTQSANPQIGVPDEIVAAIAKRLVEAARELIRK
ncbi:MAG: hypothetical protein HZA89_02435 [Verrucomicrobia bacterium]|nr:hypothetical protein [Verrucomicrobiota bacterium]